MTEQASSATARREPIPVRIDPAPLIEIFTEQTILLLAAEGSDLERAAYRKRDELLARLHPQELGALFLVADSLVKRCLQ